MKRNKNGQKAGSKDDFRLELDKYVENGVITLAERTSKYPGENLQSTQGRGEYFLYERLCTG